MSSQVTERADRYVVILSELEQRIIELVGTDRQRRNVAAGVREQKRDGRDGQALHLDGFAAEFAFAKLCNLMPDFTTDPRHGGRDLLLPDGRTVDVKHTRYEQGKLLAVPSKDFEEVSLYALIVGTPPVLRFAGWAPAVRLLNSANLTDLGRGKCYALSQADLWPWLPIEPRPTD